MYQRVVAINMTCGRLLAVVMAVENEACSELYCALKPSESDN